MQFVKSEYQDSKTSLSDTLSLVDSLFGEFRRHGINNPMTIMEQFSFLLYLRLLDYLEIQDESEEVPTGKTFIHRFNEKEQHLRWSNFTSLPDSKDMLSVLRDEVYPHFQEKIHMEDCISFLMGGVGMVINDPELLSRLINVIRMFPLEDRMQSGRIYDQILERTLRNQGIGALKTPHNVVQLMVELLDPKANDKICDPACGSGGFLTSTLEHITKTQSDKDFMPQIDTGSSEQCKTNSTNDGALSKLRIHGMEISAFQLRLAAVNLMIHGIEHPLVHFVDSLSSTFEDSHPDLVEDSFDVILTNPPFSSKYRSDYGNPKLLNKVRAMDSELLFLTLIHRMLKVGGRAAIILPENSLFSQLSKYHEIRKFLIEENELKAVISLPQGTFFSTNIKSSIVMFNKGGHTGKVFFYDFAKNVEKGDSEPTPRIPSHSIEIDISDCILKWQSLESEDLSDRTDRAFTVEADEIRNFDFVLGIDRYKEIVYQEVEFDPPEQILAQIVELNSEIGTNLKKLAQELK